VPKLHLVVPLYITTLFFPMPSHLQLQRALSRQKFRIRQMFVVNFFLAMTCTIISQNIYLPFWLTLYKNLISGPRILLLFVSIFGDTSWTNSGLGIAISRKKRALNQSTYVSSKESYLSVQRLSPKRRISFLGKES
jgi:hypothetical protein